MGRPVRRSLGSPDGKRPRVSEKCYQLRLRPVRTETYAKPHEIGRGSAGSAANPVTKVRGVDRELVAELVDQLVPKAEHNRVGGRALLGGIPRATARRANAEVLKVTGKDVRPVLLALHPRLDERRWPAQLGSTPSEVLARTPGAVARQV